MEPPCGRRLRRAVDLLLWGQRWNAESAGAGGLVDEVVPFAGRAEATERFVDRVLDGRQQSGRRGRIVWGAAEDEIVARTRARIAALPVPTGRYTRTRSSC
jgi:enoyl-CoA hydratase/carnithine racemase